MKFIQTEGIPTAVLQQVDMLIYTPSDLIKAGITFAKAKDSFDDFIYASGTVGKRVYLVTRHENQPEDGVVLWAAEDEDGAEAVVRFTRALNLPDPDAGAD